MEVAPIIAIRNSKLTHQPDKGTIQPVAIAQSDGSYREVYAESFPNNGLIWVSKEYELIEEKFSENELFKLAYYTEDEKREYENIKYKEKYWTIGSNAELFTRFEFCPVILERLPEPSSPYINNLSLLPKRAIFVCHEQFVYGPFDVNSVDGKYVISPSQHPILGLHADHVYKIDLGKIENRLFRADINGVRQAYIMDGLKIGKDTASEQLDYISDEKLFSWANKNLIKSAGKRFTRKQTQDWLASIETAKELTSIEVLRRDRLLKMIPKFVKVHNDWDKQIKQTIKTDTSLIREYVESNKDAIIAEYVEEYSNDIEKVRLEKEAELENIDSRIREANKKLRDLSNKAENLESDLQSSSFENARKHDSDLNNEINRKEDLLKSLEKEISKGEDVLKLQADVNVLGEEIKLRKNELGVYQREIKTIKNSDIKDRLVEIKTHLDLIHGNFKIDSGRTKKIKDIDRNLYDGERDAYIGSVQNYFEEYCGREFSFDEVANILICLHQSFITIFSGPPGVGKTSTVYNLSRALGIDDSFLPISVSRGWTSQKDLLGYYNPLAERFQTARTGLYDFLQSNLTFQGKNSYKLVLLDEANLSPIEHYWADFLTMCDKEGARNLNMGSGQIDDDLKVDSFVRFLCTINNDNTTESLSPRLIDRAPIIKLGLTDSYINSSHIDDASKPPVLSYDRAKDFFSADCDCEFDPNDQSVIKNIVNVLSIDQTSFGNAPTVIVSPRKYFAIKNYCYIARMIFEEEKPIDFAISQHVLPLIQGYGKDFGLRLEALHKKLIESSLYNSADQLKHIINIGKTTHHSYSYFI